MVHDRNYKYSLVSKPFLSSVFIFKKLRQEGLRMRLVIHKTWVYKYVLL